MEIWKLFGLPAHPLLVHIPVVLVPLAAIGTVLIAVRPAWRHRFGPLVVATAGVALAGVQFAIGTGEALEEHVDETEAIERHADLAGITRLSVLALFAAVTAFVIFDRHRGNRAVRGGPGTPAATGPSRLLIALAVLAVTTAVLATTTTVQSGHTGAKAVWEQTELQSGRGEGD